jgi:hypothetical protein
MESLRSLTSSPAEHGEQKQRQQPQSHQHKEIMHGKGKHLRDSNVTVIQVIPSDRANRRIDKIVRRRTEPTLVADASDLEVLTLTPDIRSQTADGNKLMKLHIINVRTGKIQDAIMLTTTDNDDYNQPKPIVAAKLMAHRRTSGKVSLS